VGGINNEQLISILEDQSLDQDETIFSYSNGFLIGKTGIENKYDKMLRGLFGKKIYEVDARGKFVKQIDYIEPKNGDSLFTSLDLESHKVAYEKMNNRRGAVVAIEIESGSIVTYLSSPSFSSNDISNGISSKEFNALLKDTNKPFFDRAAQGRYSPASTIKPAIGLFGLEESLIDWNFSINDPGYFILPEDQRVYRGWRKGGHGNVNLNKAMIVSSNTFFFSLAYQSDIDSLINHLSNFGFGENVCLDCFNPDVGLLPTPEWKMNNLNFGWFKGDTVNLGVGQGYLSATPLQLAYYASFIANKGINKRLTLIDSQTIKTQENLSLKNILNSDWDKLHSSMIGVIDDPQGTAKRLKDLKTYTVAAKSGTVELVSTETKEDYKIIRENEGNRDHAIIIAFGPMPEPKYAVSVVIENGESGGSVAGPVAIAVLNSLIEK
jgi:penicillin-binding protein 2